MDALKLLLQKKKEEIKEVNPSSDSKWVKQSDIERMRSEKYLVEQVKFETEKREKQEKIWKQKEEFLNFPQPVKKIKKDDDQKTNIVEHSKTDHSIEKSELPPLPKSEIIKRLRSMGHPITLFGEDDWMRYNRLRRCEEEQLDDVKQGVGGESNTFQKDLNMNDDDFKQLKEINEDEEDKNLLEKLNAHTFEFNVANNQDFKSKKKIVLSKGVSVQNKCDDIYIWCKKILNEWEQINQNRPEKEKNSAEGKQAIGIYRQCRRYLKPLFKLLKDNSLNEEILDALYHITHYCILREYVKAHDKYLEISIGNSPWPMGVTMVGIHERSGRAKIFSSQVAHILNDETQRKYLQAIKRLITLCQKLYPNEDPTKCVTN